MVQNMSLFHCPSCGHSTHIFGSSASSTSEGGVPAACRSNDIRFLGDIPLHASICSDADRGVPTVVAEPGSERATAFESVAEKVGMGVGLDMGRLTRDITHG